MDLFMLGLLQKMSRGGGGGKSVSHSSSYTINNTVDYPIVGLNLYGKSTQDGIPTPEAPIDIASVGDNGFDIITKDDTHFNLLSVRDNGGNINTKKQCSIAAKIGNRMKITIVASGENRTYQWQFLTPTATEWQKSNSAGNNTNTLIPTIDNVWNNVKVRCIVTDSNGKSVISDEAIIYVVADDCEVKTANIVTDVLPLCGIPVESGGNYTDNNGQQWVCDELVYNADGTGKIVKHTAKYTFTGNENFVLRGNSNAYVYSIYNLLIYKHYSGVRSVSDKYICSGTAFDSKTAIKTLKIGENQFFYNDGYPTDNYIYFGSSCVTLEDFKSEIAGSTIIYPLAAPLEIELTTADVSALMQLQTYNGMTNISNSDNADMDVKYCTNKMLSEYVIPITMGLQKQIDELQVYVQKQIDEIEAGILTPGILIIPGSYAETIIGPIITEGDE